MTRLLSIRSPLQSIFWIPSLLVVAGVLAGMHSRSVGAADKSAATASSSAASPIVAFRSAKEGNLRGTKGDNSGLPNGAELEQIAEAKAKVLSRPTPEWLPQPTIDIPAAKADDEAGMKAYVEQLPGTDAKFKMLPIRGGKFLMGSPKTETGHQPDEAPQHEVCVEPFWMEEHAVTWAEYELWGMKLEKERRGVAKREPTAHDKLVDTVAQPTNPYQEMSFGMGKEGTPAICMTQFAAKVYCRWLSAMTGRYYRLPTEAEWEYACRAGTTTAYSFGNDPAHLGDYAWFIDNSDDKYHRVATKKPNPWGLYDMHGNVSEWVIDQYVADFYGKSAGKVAMNPLAPNSKEWGRVVRGGSWDDDAEKCRSAARRASEKDWKREDPQIPKSIWYLTNATFVGFRVIRPLRVPTAEEAKKYEVDEDQLTAYKEYVTAKSNQQ
jgi:formylglycine-generating enzyme required for sulfatase activity